uniref:uncharacterized protein LOC117601764 n=1 Tax=Osmia lignaria TaxID=473952 RepID=UPI0014789F20|nr:uncharacterized protein LOC117601764 [Osmia lignaria]
MPKSRDTSPASQPAEVSAGSLAEEAHAAPHLLQMPEDPMRPSALVRSASGASVTTPEDASQPAQGTRIRSPSRLTSELQVRARVQEERLETILGFVEDLHASAAKEPLEMIMEEVTETRNTLMELHINFQRAHQDLSRLWPVSQLEHGYFKQKSASAEERAALSARKLLAQLERRLTLAAQTSQPTTTTQTLQPAPRRSRLPEIPLPTFEGEYEKWQDFKSAFTSVIKDRAELTDVDRLHYLKGAVGGAAANLIQHLPPTEDAFARAWELLDERYENKRLNVQSQLDRIYNLKPMKQRRAASLIKMTNIIGETQQSLRSFQLHDPHNCFLLGFLVRLLDTDTRERWESSLASQVEYPTMEEFLRFLLARARTLEQLERMAEQKASQPAQPTSGRPASRDIRLVQQKTAVHAAAVTQPTPSTTGTTTTSRPRTAALYPCALCSRDHFLSACPVFRDKNVEDRISVVKAQAVAVRHRDAKSLVNQLRLRRQRSSLDVHRVGGARTSQTNGVVNISFHSNYRPLSVTIQAHVLAKVTTCLPSDPPARPTLPSHLEKLNLADPQFLKSGPVDIILGADEYGQVIKPNIIRHASTPLIAQLSIFGWLIIGPLVGIQTIRRTSHQVTVNNTDRQLSELLSRFWTQEEPPPDTAPLHKPDEQECEDDFKTTHARDASGRYIVRLPLKLHPRALGNSYQTAHNCLQRTLRRLSKDAQYKQLYTKFMLEYEQLGHMVRLINDSITSPFQYFLPHHGVLKLGSTTTALRVVFNGSSPTSSGYSLNDLLHTGPNLMLNIADLLIWIRRYKHLFATDVTKMYRQIKVHPDDWSLQQILWLDDTQKETYVDDIFGGADIAEHLQDIANQLTQLCQAGGFPLAKWHSTSKSLLEDLAPDQNNASISFDDCATKILGIKWIPHQDTFNFSTISATQRVQFTKRIVLSEVAQLFDPLGFVAPVIIRAKILIQEFWLQELSWDDILPLHITQRWLRIREDLTSLAKLSIPRWFNTTTTSTVELHGFADASVLAMAAVIYLVVHAPSTGTQASLVCSKTRVTPLKRLTIPRLELTAALLLSKLMRHVHATLNMTVTQTFLWTDSEVTLAWIKTHPSKWKDYVRNRVIQIQEITQNFHWRHVPGSSNPADCASRGMATEQLQQHSLWWTGPPWITQSQDTWPKQTSVDADELDAPEARAVVSLHTANAVKEYSWELIYKYSCVNRLLRITALCLKFVDKLFKRQDTSPTHFVSAADMERARIYWIQATQFAFFKDELAAITKGTTLPSTHPFTRLTAYLDHQGIARVGGRLQHSELSHDGKHSVILPRDSRFSALLIDHAHH